MVILFFGLPKVFSIVRAPVIGTLLYIWVFTFFYLVMKMYIYCHQCHQSWVPLRYDHFVQLELTVVATNLALAHSEHPKRQALPLERFGRQLTVPGLDPEFLIYSRKSNLVTPS